MRAIILAAGMGTRLGALTHDTPKCMMVLRGKTLLERQIDNYRAQGVTDVVVIRGYLAERIRSTRASPTSRTPTTPRRASWGR